MILARHFMEEISHEMGIAPKPFSADATDVLKLHNWPGIFDREWNTERKDDDPGQTIHIPDIGMTLSEIEAEALRITSKLTRGNRSAAARILAISRPTIHRKIRDYSLEVGV